MKSAGEKNKQTLQLHSVQLNPNKAKKWGEEEEEEKKKRNTNCSRGALGKITLKEVVRVLWTGKAAGLNHNSRPLLLSAFTSSATSCPALPFDRRPR